MVVIYTSVLVSLGGAVVTLLAGLTLVNMSIALVLVVVGAGLPLWLIATTHYAVGDETLTVRSGPFKWQVALSDIESVYATNNPISSPALSLDRIAIRYQSGKELLISPKDKQAFVEALKRSDITLS